MDANDTIREFGELLLWAGCIAKAVRFRVSLHARFKAGDPAAVDTMASGFIGFAQAGEHLARTRSIGYGRRLLTFVARVDANMPALEIADLFVEMARLDCVGDALLVRAKVAARIAWLDLPERALLLREYNRFSEEERPAFLRIASGTLEELRDAYFRVGDRLPVLPKTIIALEKLLRDEGGEEPGGNVRQPLPDVPPPCGPLVGRRPLPPGNDDASSDAPGSTAGRERHLVGASATVAA